MVLDTCGRLVADICVVRGDRKTQRFVVDDGETPPVVVDLTGASALLSVHSVPDPVDETTELFQMIGVIAAPTNGEIDFTPSVVQADQVIDTYFYDVEVILPGSIPITISSGEWIVSVDRANRDT